jgi:lipopolysaccharide biosynthesis regulator YciM
MDVEKAIDHLLDLHAKAEIRADRADARMDRFEKQLNATANLVRKLLQLGIEIRLEQKQFRKDLNTLARAQAKTEEKLDRLIDVLLRANSDGRPGGNGR